MRILIVLSLASCSTGKAGIGPTTLPDDSPAADPTIDTGSAAETTEFLPCTAFAPGGEGARLDDNTLLDDDVAECTERLHSLVMARGSTYEVRLSEWTSESDAHFELRDWIGELLVGATALEQGDAIEVTATWSGEHALIVRSIEGQSADYALSATCIAGCAASTTRYPIVFMHGMAGTDSFLNVLDYWYDVVPTLTDAGYAAHAAAVDPFQPSPVRSAGWMTHLDVLFASGQARRVNLIGHSQGGLDARYVASLLDVEQRVQSVTTISTPHLGAASADVIHDLVDGSLLGGIVLDTIFDELVGLYGLTSDQDILAQTEQLTGIASDAFNHDVVDRADVQYFSWAGRTCDLIDLLCQLDNGGEIVDPLLSGTHLLTSLLEGPNDGLVSVESSTWGTLLGELPADHLDEVGLLPGTTSPGFDHRQFYLDEAVRLSAVGL